ncbi:MAG: hypothetical protein PVS3B3_12350 [Ktedonobacteraceae bacterium]
MATNTEYARPLTVPHAEDARTKWARRRDVPLAILAWVAVVAVILWGAGHIVRSLLILAIAALIAYALAPGVRFLQRVMPRFLAILIMYLIVLGAISLLIYLIASAAIRQTISFAHDMPSLLNLGTNDQSNPLEQTLATFGITHAQIVAARQQLTEQVKGIARDAVPILRSAFDVILDTIIVAVISIYMLIDGSRIANWIRLHAPQTARANAVIDTLQRVVGGYIRGQFILAVLIGFLVSIGMLLFRVPYAIFLGVLAFILAFIPVLGTFVSGAVCVLIALTHGWPIALGVLVYFLGVHIVEGDVVGPRIVGKAVGLHPIVSLFALIAGAELFGVWGALFASPIAGVLQSLITAIWSQWSARHPEQFEQVQATADERTDKEPGEVNTSDDATKIAGTEEQ